MFVKQKDILEKLVIGSDGNRVGVVKEVAFNLQGELGFIVAPEEGDERAIPYGAIQAIGEFILLKPDALTSSPTPEPAWTAPAAAPAAGPAPVAPMAPAGAAGCPKCGRTLKAGTRFCVGCGAKLAEG